MPPLRCSVCTSEPSGEHLVYVPEVCVRHTEAEGGHAKMPEDTDREWRRHVFGCAGPEPLVQIAARVLEAIVLMKTFASCDTVISTWFPDLIRSLLTYMLPASWLSNLERCIFEEYSPREYHSRNIPWLVRSVVWRMRGCPPWIVIKPKVPGLAALKRVLHFLLNEVSDLRTVCMSQW